MQIELRHLLEMINHAREEAPNEACGILAGKNDRVSRLYRARNAENSPNAYRLFPDEQYRIFKDIEDKGLEIIGIYHSHPFSPPVPSDTDIRQAYSPQVSHVVISLAENEEPQVTAFRISEDEVIEQDLLVV
jgi:proteasome lid subunit RPN8/RPN11